MLPALSSLNFSSLLISARSAGVSQNPLDYVCRHFFDQVGSIVIEKFGERLGEFLVAQRVNQAFFGFSVQFDKNFGGKFFGQQSVDSREHFFIQFIQNLGNIHRIFVL